VRDTPRLMGWLVPFLTGELIVVQVEQNQSAEEAELRGDSS